MTVPLRAARSGALFPLLVNLGAVALIAAGVYFLPRLFDRSEQTIVARTAEEPAGEARIVSAVVREGEEKLAAKDREIVGIQARIDDLGRELVDLRTGRDAEIARREQALRDALAAELAAERQRLEKAGAVGGFASRSSSPPSTSGGTPSSRSSSRPTGGRRTPRSPAKEKEIDARFAAYQRELAAARDARTLLEADLAAAQASGAAAISEQQRLARELAAVTEQSRREELAVGQLTTAWQSVGNAMTAGSGTRRCRASTPSPGCSPRRPSPRCPAVQRRAAVDGFLVESMRRLVAADRGDPAAGGAATAAREASSLVVQAEAKFTDGDTKAARELYLAAIGKLPALQTAYERLVGHGRGGAGPHPRARRWPTPWPRPTPRTRPENWKTALDRYGRALGLLRDTARDLPRAASRIADAGYRQATAEQAARQDRSARTLVEKADGLLRRGDLDEALVTYASVVDSYPLSSQVKNAVAGISSVVDAQITLKEDEIAALEQSLANAQAAEKRLSPTPRQGHAASDAQAGTGGPRRRRGEGQGRRRRAGPRAGSSRRRCGEGQVAADALAREKARQDAESKAAAAVQDR